jgi:hypothetical protein
MAATSIRKSKDDIHGSFRQFPGEPSPRSVLGACANDRVGSRARGGVAQREASEVRSATAAQQAPGLSFERVEADRLS